MAMMAALLRAINLGGKTKLAMADLRALFAEMGFDGARTILQTGNVVFDAGAADPVALAKTLEATTADRLGLQTAYLLRTAAEWEALIAANPFPAAARDDPAHLVVMPLQAKPAAQAVTALTEAILGREEVAVVGRVLYAVYPDGIGESKLTTKLIESKLGTVSTGRNWNTALKIAGALKA